MDSANKEQLYWETYFANKPTLFGLISNNYNKQSILVNVGNIEPIQGGVIVSEPQSSADSIREWLVGLIMDEFGFSPAEDKCPVELSEGLDEDKIFWRISYKN